jgi:RNA recognition motif-containing protein
VTGKSKGNATVQYATANDARKAVRLFNDDKHMSMRLRVRLDRGAIITGVPMPSTGSSGSDGTTSTTRPTRQSRDNTEPVIVDGSVCQR